MGEAPWQMKEEIDVRRLELERDINTLQRKVKQDIDDVRMKVRRTFDWRVQYGVHTGAAMGVAFAAGILLAAMSPKRRAKT